MISLGYILESSEFVLNSSLIPSSYLEVYFSVFKQYWWEVLHVPTCCWVDLLRGPRTRNFLDLYGRMSDIYLYIYGIKLLSSFQGPISLSVLPQKRFHFVFSRVRIEATA